MVAAALGERYGSGSKKDGKRFLEKIVHVPLNIPKADRKTLRAFCLKLLNEVLADLKIELTQQESGAFLEQFMKLEPGLTTPRLAKRYANALAFSLPIFDGEVSLVDVMVLEGIRIFYPRAFDVIRNDPDTFVGSDEAGALQMMVDADNINARREATLADAKKGLSPIARDSVTALVHFLFPMLASPGIRPQSNTTQRVSVNKYLRRYLASGTPAGDISDRQLEDFLAKLKSESKDDLKRQMQGILLELSPRVFADELSGRLDDLSPEASLMLADILAESGELFPFSLGHLSASYFAALVIAKSIGKLQKEERPAAVERMIRSARPITFAAEVYKSIAADEGEREDNRLLSVEEEQRVGRILADRIKEFAEGHPILREPEAGGFLLAAWASLGSRDETNEYLTNSFVKPDNALEFVQRYFPTEWPFARSSYDSVAEKVDPEVVFAALLSLYGPNLNSATYDHGDKGTKRDLAAYQFAQTHRKIKEGDKSGGTNVPPANS